MANPLLAALLAVTAAPSILQGMTNMFPPFASGMARKGYRDRPNLLPSPDSLTAMRLKEQITEAQFHELMANAGYSVDIADKFLANTKNYMSAFDYIAVWRRGLMSDGELDDTLKQQGFDDRTQALLKDATIYYPTPQDIVRFGVRDVYTPSTITLYGLDQDVPPNLFETGRKAGLTDEIALDYWMAHWELPSPTQVYEMLHRGLLTEEDVATYLKVADYMPYWRDKLAAISYNNLTRVDIRRMYATGILNEEQVKRAYLDDGYNDEKATWLTQFTVLEAKHTQESTPLAVLITAYKTGLKDRDEVISEAVKAGYDPDTVLTEVNNADAQVKQELIDLQADAIIDQYSRGAITLEEVQTQLSMLGVPPRLMQLTIQRELAQARKRSKHASKHDLDAWWTMGLISDALYISRLTNMGYQNDDIQRYLAELLVKELLGSEKKTPWAPISRTTVLVQDDAATLLHKIEQAAQE